MAACALDGGAELVGAVAERRLRGPRRDHVGSPAMGLRADLALDVGLLHSLRKARQPGGVTRLVSCAEDQLPSYRGLRIGHTLQIPSFSRHPRTGDWFRVKEALDPVARTSAPHTSLPFTVEVDS